MRTFLIVFWGVDAFGALVRVEYFDSAQPENAWVKGMIKMDAGRVKYYRFTAAHTYNQVMGNFTSN